MNHKNHNQESFDSKQMSQQDKEISILKDKLSVAQIVNNASLNINQFAAEKLKEIDEMINLEKKPIDSLNLRNYVKIAAMEMQKMMDDYSVLASIQSGPIVVLPSAYDIHHQIHAFLNGEIDDEKILDQKLILVDEVNGSEGKSHSKNIPNIQGLDEWVESDFENEKPKKKSKMPEATSSKKTYKCKWPNCDFKSYDKDFVIEHITEQHIGKGFRLIDCHNCSKTLIYKKINSRNQIHPESHFEEFNKIVSSKKSLVNQKLKYGHPNHSPLNRTLNHFKNFVHMSSGLKKNSFKVKKNKFNPKSYIKTLE